MFEFTIEFIACNLSVALQKTLSILMWKTNPPTNLVSGGVVRAYYYAAVSSSGVVSGAVVSSTGVSTTSSSTTGVLFSSMMLVSFGLVRPLP